MAINLETGVGDLAGRQPHLIPVLEDLGIDYCCGGERPLADACRLAGHDPTTVLATLVAAVEKAAPEANAAPIDWQRESLSHLIDHIVSVHHEYLRQALPRIGDLMQRVLVAHGEHHPELAQVSRQYHDLRDELEAHLQKEERILFPMIQSMDVTGSLDDVHCGTVAQPISVMVAEHDNAGEALRNLRTWTDQYTPPADACPTYRALLADLAALERDLHVHIHKENNLLHPRAVALEARLVDQPRGM